MTEYSGCFKQLIKCSNIEFYLFVWKFKRNDSLMYGLAPIRFPPFAAEVRSKHEKAMDWEHSTGRQNWYSDENHWNLSSKPSSRTWLKYIFFNTGIESNKNLALIVVCTTIFPKKYYLRDGMHGAITMFRSLTSCPEPRNRLGHHSKRLSLSLKCVSNAEKLWVMIMKQSSQIHQENLCSVDK